MTNEQRAAIEKLIGRPLSAVEIGRGSIDRPQDRKLRERIAAANQQSVGISPNWQNVMEHDGAKPKRETRAAAFKRLRESQEQRVQDSQVSKEHAAKLATDPAYLRMNRIAEHALERARWNDQIPQSRWETLLAMRQAAKADDRDTFKALNDSHVAYLQSVTNDKQAMIDAEIARLRDVQSSLAEERFEEPLPTPAQESYSKIRRADGMINLVNKADGEIIEYDERIPHAGELALERLAGHQAATAGTLGEPVPFSMNH